LKKKSKIYHLKKRQRLKKKFNSIGSIVYDDMFEKVCNVKDYFNEETKKTLEEKYS